MFDGINIPTGSRAKTTGKAIAVAKDIIINKCGVPKYYIDDDLPNNHVEWNGRHIYIKLKNPDWPRVANETGPWEIGYHGTMFDVIKCIIKDGYDETADPPRLFRRGKKTIFGSGIYTSQYLDYTTQSWTTKVGPSWHAEPFQFKDRYYQVILENRVLARDRYGYETLPWTAASANCDAFLTV